jgi:hypothetical protein
MTTMAIVSTGSPTTPDTTAAAMSTMIMKSDTWSISIRAIDRLDPAGSSLAP